MGITIIESRKGQNELNYLELDPKLWSKRRANAGKTKTTEWRMQQQKSSTGRSKTGRQVQTKRSFPFFNHKRLVITNNSSHESLNLPDLANDE